MLSDIDQFGRGMKNDLDKDKNKTKKILHSLSEIKKLLEKKNFVPEEGVVAHNADLSNNSLDHIINLDNLRTKVQLIESKINSLDLLLKNK